MAVNSNGSNNRVAGRDFHEKNIQIERYDGSQTVNIAIPSNNDDDDRPLLKAQRKELNSWLLLLQKLAILKRLLFGKKYMRRWCSWYDDMTVNQYKTAESFLHAMLERCKDHDACKALVSLLLRNSEDCGLRQKLLRYCHINFGTGRLNDLTRSQLQSALSWLEQQSASSHTESSTLPEVRLRASELIRLYPKEIIFFICVGFW
ncbi:putative transmembrane protein [Escherichia coli]|uniref:Putative transmembrane protein n=1 Tax=Escherichia coli TaxID=562 RepID=A0A3S4MA45_ECOLX|nr:putative transmembrane protein [Escherichia coli]